MDRFRYKKKKNRSFLATVYLDTGLKTKRRGLQLYRHAAETRWYVAADDGDPFFYTYELFDHKPCAKMDFSAVTLCVTY